MGNLNIFQHLNSEYGNNWSTKNPVVTVHEAESRKSLYITLVVCGRECVGCCSTNVDFSRDVDQELLFGAVTNAYNIMNASYTPNFTKEQIDFMNDFKKKHNIDNNEKMNSYIAMWRSDMTKDKLNEENINNFISYIKNNNL